MLPQRIAQWRRAQEQLQALNRELMAMHTENCDNLEDGEAVHQLLDATTKAVRVANKVLEES